MSTSNSALADEQEALNSIYDAGTLSLTNDDADVVSPTLAVLNLPNLPFSFLLSFPPAYPDAAPSVDGTQSTGAHTKRGQGEAAVHTLREVLEKIYVPGQVCLFDLIEEVTPLLSSSDAGSSVVVGEATSTPQVPRDGAPQAAAEAAENRSAPSHDTPAANPGDLIYSPSTSTAATSIPPPNWNLSEALVVSKSTFVARSLAVTSLAQATDAISHLLSSNRRVASATHNITAWRIKQIHQQQHYSQSQSKPAPDPQHTAAETVIQDCDDDGETAAGGRLLHLMQLMDVWNCVVVVTRWYGGVKMGPDRFRCINSVARESLVNGGFVKEEKEGHGGGSGKGGKGRKK